MTGLITRWKDGAKTSVAKTVAMEGPWSLVQVTTLEGNPARRSFRAMRQFYVHCGFEYAGELNSLIAMEQFPSPGDQWFDVDGDPSLLDRIREHVSQRNPDLIKAMEQLWPDPKPGTLVSYQSVIGPARLEVLGVETLTDFPEPGLNTSAVSIRREVQLKPGVSEWSYLYAPEYGQHASYAFKNWQKSKMVRLTHARLSGTSCESRGRPRTPEALAAAANDALNLLDGEGLVGLSPPDAKEARSLSQPTSTDGGDQTARRLLDYHGRIPVYMDVALKAGGVEKDPAGFARIQIEPQYPTYPQSLVSTMELTVEKTEDGGWALHDPAGLPQTLIDAMGLGEQLRIRT